MRVCVLWVSVCLAGSAFAQGSPPAGQVRVSPQLSSEIGPPGRAYRTCAIQHVQRIAASNRSSTFEQHEFSIRPACGTHVDQIVLAFLRYGHTQEETNVWVRNAYNNFRPQLQRAFAETQQQRPQSPPNDPKQRFK
jgi:hypothetical protein